MATATKHVTMPEPPPYTVTLELNQREAETLRYVLGRISGPGAGPRGATDEVYNALGDAGIDVARARFEGNPNLYLLER